jgi:hypothetical protein
MKYWIALAGLLTIHTVSYASNLDVAISEHSIDGSYENFYGNNFSTQLSVFHSKTDGVKNSDVENPATFDSKLDNIETNMLAYGLFANGKHGRIRSHLGGKIFYIASEYSNVMHGLALGGGIDIFINSSFFLTGQLFYAPDIVTGGDFNNYIESSLQANFQIMRNASMYIGYKQLEADFETPKDRTREFYDGAYVGFRFGI